MAADNLTTIWQVYDSVIFTAGLAIGAGGRRGVDFIIHTTQALRGNDPHKTNPHQQGEQSPSDGKASAHAEEK